MIITSGLMIFTVKSEAVGFELIRPPTASLTIIVNGAVFLVENGDVI